MVKPITIKASGHSHRRAALGADDGFHILLPTKTPFLLQSYEIIGHYHYEK
jgi:hypothetical protein